MIDHVRSLQGDIPVTTGKAGSPSLSSFLSSLEGSETRDQTEPTSYGGVRGTVIMVGMEDTEEDVLSRDPALSWGLGLFWPWELLQ